MSPSSECASGFPLHTNHAIIPAPLENLAVQARRPEEASDDLPIELESVSCDQGKMVSRRPGTEFSEQGERVAITPFADNRRRPEARPDFDGSEDPNRRTVFSAHHQPNFVGLQFLNVELRDSQRAESTARRSGFLQPAVHRVPSNLLHPRDRRFVHAFDAESGNLIERGPAMLESVIDLCPGSGRRFCGKACIGIVGACPSGLCRIRNE